MSDFARSEQPGDGDERSILVGWLAFHRDALEVKCGGLTGEQLVERAADPSHLSLLGIVRHMAEMERAYGVWREEKAKTDAALAQHPTLDEFGEGNGRSVRWNLAKLIGEYARHNGHADIIRERIDGQTGE
jgi:hypothetical protein